MNKSNYFCSKKCLLEPINRIFFLSINLMFIGKICVFSHEGNNRVSFYSYIAPTWHVLSSKYVQNGTAILGLTSFGCLSIVIFNVVKNISCPLTLNDEKFSATLIIIFVVLRFHFISIHNSRKNADIKNDKHHYSLSFHSLPF